MANDGEESHMMVKCWILFDVLKTFGKSYLESLSQNALVFKDVFYIQLSTVKGRPTPNLTNLWTSHFVVPLQLRVGITVSGENPPLPQGNTKAFNNILLGDDGAS